jgi:hypothetical protein
VPRQEVEAFVTERGQRFIATCLAHFDRGMNSAEIASATFEHEASVAWAIRVGREQRRDA